MTPAHSSVLYAMVRLGQLGSRSAVRDDSAVDRPETRYAWNGNAALAFQVMGAGPIELVYLQEQLSNVVLNWEHPSFARFARALSRVVRLIVVDRRGLGCSERFTPADIPRSKFSSTTCCACSTWQGVNAPWYSLPVTAAS
jgi:hypothetical protein